MRIRVTTFARPDDDLLKRFSLRYLGGKTVWKDLQFVTDESYDKLVILTYPYATTLQQGYLPEKSLTFMTEPSISYFAKAHPTGAVMNIHLHLPFFPMQLEGMDGLCVRGDIAPLKKDVLSCIVSELSGLEGHKRRLEFVYALDQLFEEGLDIFGRPSKGNFFQQLSNYKGFLPEKYDGLWSYCYHFACENCFQEGYFTEKIVDPIITESLCFYDGCPNIENYIDSRAYIKISVRDIASSISMIIKSIHDQEWKKRLPYIQQEKQRFLSDLHPFNLIWMAVHDKDLHCIYK